MDIGQDSDRCFGADQRIVWSYGSYLVDPASSHMLVKLWQVKGRLKRLGLVLRGDTVKLPGHPE